MLVIKVKSDDCIICFQIDTVYIKPIETVGEKII